MNQYLDEPGKELEFVKFTRMEKPRKVFFYKRKNEDGEVIEESDLIACYEQEAGMFGQFHKLMGVGDGIAYYNCLRNAKINQLCPACGGAKTIEQAQKSTVPGQEGVAIMVKVPCETCKGMGQSAKLLRPGMVISVADSKRILQEAFDAEWEASDKSPNKKKPRYDNKHFDGSVLAHENSDEIMKGFGNSAQPKPGLQ